jgi:hypothetical protein
MRLTLPTTKLGGIWKNLVRRSTTRACSVAAVAVSSNGVGGHVTGMVTSSPGLRLLHPTCVPGRSYHDGGTD